MAGGPAGHAEAVPGGPQLQDQRLGPARDGDQPQPPVLAADGVAGASQDSSHRQGDREQNTYFSTLPQFWIIKTTMRQSMFEF